MEDHKINEVADSSEAEMRESAFAQDRLSWPPLEPPLHGHGWPQDIELPTTVHDLESAPPEIQPDQHKAASTCSEE